MRCGNSGSRVQCFQITVNMNVMPRVMDLFFVELGDVHSPRFESLVFGSYQSGSKPLVEQLSREVAAARCP